MQKRLLSVVLTAVLVGGLLTVGATSASAAANGDIRSFFPNKNNSDTFHVSDRFDGTDALAHLTAVTRPEIDRVDWVICPVGADAGNGLIEQGELASCNVEAGSDAEPVQLPGGGGLFPTTGDEAYGINWDIPNGLDLQLRDVLVLGCVGTGRTVSGPGQNCIQDYVEDVVFDDSTGGTGDQASTGEFTELCTTAPLTECSVTGAAPDTRAQVDARFSAFEHGDPVPNDGFTVRITSDPQTTAMSLLIDNTGNDPEPGGGPDANNAPNGSDQTVACTMIDSTTTFKRWECTADPQDNSKLALYAYGTGVSPTSPPSPVAWPATRAYDIHASHSVARAAAGVSARFVPDVGPGYDDLDQVDNSSTCADPDTEDRNSLGNLSRVHGCVTDQFGQAFEPSQVTFESTGVGEIDDVGAGGTCTDEDADGEQDKCEDVTSETVGTTYAEYAIDLSNVEEEGTQTVVFCVDDNDNGCADAGALSATVTKEWQAVPDTVFLAFVTPAPDDPNDPCRTGRTSKENAVGDRDDLIACLYDSAGGNLIPATTTKPDGGRLQWFIEPVGGGEVTATRFIRPQPPAEDDGTGRAMARIRAFRRGNDWITVVLVNENNVELSRARVQKRVTEGGGGPGPGPGRRAESSVTIRGKFKGQVVSERGSCKRRRLVLLKKRRPGRDRTVGRDRTNRAANWRIRKPNARGRFYAKIRRTARCTGDRSPTVRRR